MASTSRRAEADPGLADESFAAWIGLLRAHAGLVDVLGHELQRDAGLPLTWFDVLTQLAAAPDGQLRMQDLAAAIVLSKSGLTRVVDRLETEGLVERTSCPTDRRGTYASITAAGRRAVARARPLHLRGVQQHFAQSLTPAEVAAITSATTRIIDALHAGCAAEDACGSDDAV